MGFDISLLDAPRRRSRIQQHAEHLGYRYLYTVRPPKGHGDPVGYAINIAAGIHAAAIVVYDLEVVGHSPARICARFDLETVCPGETWSRAIPPLAAPEAHGLPDWKLAPAEAHRLFRLHIECRVVECLRKAAAVRCLVNAGKLKLAATTPRQRAEARGIAWESLAAGRPRMSNETLTMLGALDGLIDEMRGVAHR